MKLSIIERKYEATEKMKEKMRAKLNKFDKFFDSETEAQLVLSKEKEREICEITIFYHDTIFRTEETTKEMYASFDECIENLKKQLRKHKTRLENRFKHKSFQPEDFFFNGEADQVKEETEFKIIKSKRISVKPMFVEEAILQMNLLGHEFFVFLNADTDEIDVVYKRKDGHYGIIATQQN